MVCIGNIDSMDKCAVLSFAVRPLADERAEVLTITPVLNGTPLTELVSRFEREHGFDPAGGYGGLVPAWFAFGPLERYFMAESTDSHWESGLYLLGCQCGEVGCWPLAGRIVRTGNTMVWDMFRQPHRPDRDYSRFGPFAFEVEQYKTVVNETASQFGSP
jgi:hypothetical protein